MDKFSKVLSPQISSTNEEKFIGIYQGMMSVLRNGVVIGDKKFDTLAFLNSQVEENSLWIFASRPGLTAADIRKRQVI